MKKLTMKTQNCENGGVMRMCITCSVLSPKYTSFLYAYSSIQSNTEPFKVYSICPHMRIRKLHLCPASPVFFFRCYD